MQCFWHLALWWSKAGPRRSSSEAENLRLDFRSTSVVHDSTVCIFLRIGRYELSMSYAASLDTGYYVDSTKAPWETTSRALNSSVVHLMYWNGDRGNGRMSLTQIAGSYSSLHSFEAFGGFTWMNS